MSLPNTDDYLEAGRAPAALLRIGLYAVVLIAPLVVAVVSEPKTDHPFIQELAKNLAMVGYTVLAMQFVLSARFRWIERPFGLDCVFQFHRSMGIFAAALLLAHPFLYASAGEWDLLLGFDHPWEILLGKLALVALALLVIGAVYRQALSLEFERWRRVHNGLALAVLLLGFVHSAKAGGDFDGAPMLTLWAMLLVLATASYVHHQWLAERWSRRRSYQVVRVDQETHDVWSVELSPVDGAPAVHNLPGQFGFFKFHGVGGSDEEHPFTIASAPNASGHVVATIKASGDYTATICQARVGDRASVSGPYGRFSYLLHPNEEDLVFVAGGVGVTPMLSMLRHMRTVRAGRSVVLLFGNRRERDIIARTELDEIAKGSLPRLKVVHVLSDADEGWTGESGRIDQALLGRFLGPHNRKAFYVCGPPAMSAEITRSLRRLGVSERFIHLEPFSL